MIPLPLQLPLPLLIKEKVEYYYYYNNWKDSIKRLHNQYKEKLQIFDDEDGFIEWKKHSSCTIDLFANTICNIGGKSHRRKHIREFRKFGNCQILPIARLPPKYKYSSGLNNPNGYKSQ